MQIVSSGLRSKKSRGIIGSKQKQEMGFIWNEFRMKLNMFFKSVNYTDVSSEAA